MDEENFIRKSRRHEVHGEKISRTHKSIPKEGPIANFNLFLNKRRLLREGSSIAKSYLNIIEKKPVVLSGHHHKPTPVDGHYYGGIKHRGRHLTDRTTR